MNANLYEIRRPHGARLFATLCLAGALAAPAFGAQEQDGGEAVVRWYDVRALSAASLEDPEGVTMMLHLSSTFLDSLEPDSYDVPLESNDSLRAFGWSDLLRGCLGADRSRSNRFKVEDRGSFLRIEAGEATQSEVERILQDLEAHVLRSIELDLYVLPAEAIGGATRAVLSPGEVEELIGRAALLDYSRARARLGQRVRMAGESIKATLYDYDVEVAQAARVADPSVSILREGTEVGAIVRASGDGFFVRAWGRRGARVGEQRRVELTSLAKANVELPTMSTSMHAGSARIEKGGGIILGQDWSDDGLWLLRVRDTDRGEDREGASTDPFIHFGSLTTPALLVEPPQLARTSPSGGWSYPDDGLFEQLSGTSGGPALTPDEVSEALQSERESLEERGGMLVLNDAVYVRGSGPLRERSRVLVGEWTAALAGETIEVDVRFGVVGSEAATRVARGELTARELAATLPNRAFGAVRPGDSLLVLGGIERFYVKDHDVEIADSSAIGDPIIGHTFNGVSLWCVPSAARSGRISAWFDFAVQLPGETGTIASADWAPREAHFLEQGDRDRTGADNQRDRTRYGPAGDLTLEGRIELPQTARGSVRSMMQLEEEQWALLCCSGLGAMEGTLVAVVKAHAFDR